MCISVTFPDTGENLTKFLSSTRKGRDLFAFAVSKVQLDKDEFSKVCFRFISVSDEKSSQHFTKDIRKTHRTRFWLLNF